MADLYTIWANKEGDISDLDWVNGMKSFFDHDKRTSSTSCSSVVLKDPPFNFRIIILNLFSLIQDHILVGYQEQ